MTEGPDWSPTFQRVEQVPGRSAAGGKQRLTEKDVADKWAYLNQRNAASIAVSMGAVDTGDDFEPYGALADIAAANADAITALDGRIDTLETADADVAGATHAATAKATPADADEIPLVDSGAAWVLKSLSWANIKATIGGWYDTATRTMSGKTLASPIITGAAKVSQSAALEVYNTADQATNYERGVMQYRSNVLEIGHVYGGTGTTFRSVRIGLGISAGGQPVGRYFDINPAIPFFSFEWVATGSAGAAVRIGAPSTLQASSGAQQALAIQPTINQSGTASYTALLVNPTETATGSGTKRLIDAQVGGTTKFNVDNAGDVFLANVSTPPGTPSGGGVLYAESGALRYKGSSGTVTTIAPA